MPGRTNDRCDQPDQTKNQDWGVSFFHLLDPPVGRGQIGPGRLQLKHLLRRKANRDSPRYRFVPMHAKTQPHVTRGIAGTAVDIVVDTHCTAGI
jgi:hypothetical protein